MQQLPPELAGPLTATNPEFAQSGGDLFIVGGYGTDLQSGKFTTFGSLIKVKVDRLIAAITTGMPITDCFASSPAADNRLRVTGGSLKVSQNSFYLFFGQDFAGPYSVQNADYNREGRQFQRYTEKVRAFTLNSDLSIATFQQIDGGYDPNLPYHRRDFNAVEIIQADGETASFTVYGGVFRAGQVAGHTMPIDIASASLAPTVAMRSQFRQGLNHYDCAPDGIRHRDFQFLYNVFWRYQSVSLRRRIKFPDPGSPQPRRRH